MYSTQESEWTVYHPPKSVSYGHQSRLRNVRQAWATTENFLVELTTPKISPPINFQCVADPSMIDTAIANVCLVSARQQFGTEQDPASPIRRWTLGDNQLKAAIQLALDSDKWPRQPAGIIRLNFGYTFAWRELTDRSPPAGHVAYDTIWLHNASSLHVIMDRQRLFLQPTFIFPFPRGSTKFADFFSRVDELCPFRFRNAYFKSDKIRPIDDK